MAELVPQPLGDLIRRAVVEHARAKTVYDLHARDFWSPNPAVDLSVVTHGARASTALGPAAGPHAQLAQNVALAWLGGARILELKTVQIKDQLEIPRPCIDVANVGYNVEWSQELRLEASLQEYVNAWYLVHALPRLGVVDVPEHARATQFDVSVGYSLEGIQSDPVRRWLDALRDARPLLRAAREGLPRDVRALADVDPPGEVYDCVTLSTFHGCPADEIERIVEHLIAQHGVHVVVKMNPTLLGFDAVSALLHDRLGYATVRAHRPAFESDLQWDDAVAMLGRLSTVASRHGRSLGVKFTNTLVVENHKTFFSDPVMYMSGAPLHVLAVTLAARFTEATDGRYPVSFSAGIDRQNFHEAVACGMAPVTTCTDLLRPGGYGRLAKYLRNLEADMVKVGARTLPEYIVRRAGLDAALARDPAAVARAQRANLAAYADRVAADPRYTAAKNSAVPRRIGSKLALFDCINCDKCIAVCPNDANFAVDVAPGEYAAPELVVGAAGVEQRAGEAYHVREVQQLANYADACNDCGNCDVFCPEEGGPYKVKPRFFGSRETLLRDPHDGIYAWREGAARGVVARVQGVVHALTARDGAVEFTDGTITATLDPVTHTVRAATARADAPAGHALPLWRYHALRLLLDGALEGVNPVSQGSLALPAPSRPDPTVKLEVV